MDEYITRDQLDQVLRDNPGGQRNKGSDWRGRMERIASGKPLVLYPTDKKHAHNLKCTAYQYAKQYDLTITVRTVQYGDQLKLLIWRV